MFVLCPCICCRRTKIVNFPDFYVCGIHWCLNLSAHKLRIMEVFVFRDLLTLFFKKLPHVVNMECHFFLSVKFRFSHTEAQFGFTWWWQLNSEFVNFLLWKSRDLTYVSSFIFLRFVWQKSLHYCFKQIERFRAVEGSSYKPPQNFHYFCNCSWFDVKMEVSISKVPGMTDFSSFESIWQHFK